MSTTTGNTPLFSLLTCQRSILVSLKKLLSWELHILCDPTGDIHFYCLPYDTQNTSQVHTHKLDLFKIARYQTQMACAL